jgi:hypothetical protein
MLKLFLLLVLVLIIICGGSPMADVYQSLPDQIQEWRIVGKNVFYDRETLYDYMNGGAEVYLAFDFRRVLVRKFGRPDGKEMTLDIYEMGSAPEAYGIFSCDREDEEAGIGQGSEYGFGLLRFWKGSYFVTVMTDAEGEAVDRAILELGRKIDKLLGPEGPEPEMLKILPQEGLRKNRVSYFHSNISLNNRFYIASENILNLDRMTQCVFAEYGPAGEEPVSLLIVRYADEQKALAAYRSFIANFMPEANETGYIQTENQKWTQAQVIRDTVAVVFDAPSGDMAQQMLSGIKTTN